VTNPEQMPLPATDKPAEISTLNPVIPSPPAKPLAKHSQGWQGDFKPLGAMRDSFYELMEQDRQGFRH
jgi:hypothetical protein